MVYQDQIYLYGGYFKEVVSSDKSASEKGTVHADMWTLDPRTWEWNKVISCNFLEHCINFHHDSVSSFTLSHISTE
jgi:hypothetical protein